MRIIILVIFYFVFVSGVPYAFDPYPIIDCLGIPDDDPLEELIEWRGVIGEDIWYGYDSKPEWGLPDDATIHEWVRFDTTVGKRWVIVLSSNSVPNQLYAMPFISLKPHVDASGIHYGPHPCGIYKISEPE